MRSIFNLIRWKNLLLILLVQALIKYALFDSLNVSQTLSDLQFLLLSFATICIAAAGNIINDVYDVETDLVNKPKKVVIGRTISEKTGLNLFIIFNVIGVGLGFYLSNQIDKSGFAVLFVIISALLYLYATQLKRTFLVGNMIISILVGLSIIIVGIFELIPAITVQNRPDQHYAFNIVCIYALFAFMINLLREIVKDIEDINGDYKAGMRTLPIIIGRDRATLVTFALSFIPLLAVIYYVIGYLYNNQLVVGYFLVFVVAPMLYFTIKIHSAETKKELHHLSNILKLIMLFGILSLLQYPILY